MKTIKIIIVATLLSASAFTVIKSVLWKVKEDYSIKTGVCVFKGLKATLIFNEEKPGSSQIIASIDARTINTGNGIMNAHAREKEALYTEKYPLITFSSTAIKKISASRYEATGNLTLKGITKEIKLPFTFDSKNNIIDRFPMVAKETFDGKITIHPKDYNITREGTPEEVIVEISIPVVQ